jgi:hypothetical protein
MNFGGVIGFALLEWITEHLLVLGVFGVGVGVVYKVHPGAGLSLAGAAALNLLSTVLWRDLVRVGASGGNYEAGMILALIIQTGLGYLTGALVIIAMVALARALGQAQGASRHR